jgi:hypothetical protein
LSGFLSSAGAAEVDGDFAILSALVWGATSAAAKITAAPQVAAAEADIPATLNRFRRASIDCRIIMAAHQWHRQEQTESLAPFIGTRACRKSCTGMRGGHGLVMPELFATG